MQKSVTLPPKPGWKKICSAFLALFLLKVFILAGSLSAAPTSSHLARRVVEGWLTVSGNPLGTDLRSRSVGKVKAYPEGAESAHYFIVHLREESRRKGFVVVSADDRIEPIIGVFPDTPGYDPSPANPAHALIDADLSARMQGLAFKPNTKEKLPDENSDADGALPDPARKWDFLQSLDAETPSLRMETVPDVRVAPLIASKWDQAGAGGENCYNYYTPNNYVCGCVATAMAQLMRYHNHPLEGVGTPAFKITITNVTDPDADPPETETIQQEATLRGGDGAGGPYAWEEMVLDPAAGATEVQRQAIGALTYDAGVSVGMSYSSGGSGASLYYSDTALENIFGYENSIHLYTASNQDPANFSSTINPNLDAGYPVILGLSRDSGGHAVICDGYGYDLSSLYHHLNMGWGGYNDAWYNLPDVDSHYVYDTVHTLLFNIFPDESGEIISGRVTDSGGNPVGGVEITAVRSGGGTFTDVTDPNGIYALAGLLPDSQYTITASRTGYSFGTETCATGLSSEWGEFGTVWGVDFVGSASGGEAAALLPITILELLLLD
jgi:hypothetical protein